MKKAKIKPFNKFLNLIIGGNVLAITLCPFGIYTRIKLNKVEVNHEQIHWRQQSEMLVIPFYLWYIVEWFVRVITFHSRPYYNISFEQEAYGNDNNAKYLSERKRYAWFKYLKTRIKRNDRVE